MSSSPGVWTVFQRETPSSLTPETKVRVQSHMLQVEEERMKAGCGPEAGSTRLGGRAAGPKPGDSASSSPLERGLKDSRHRMAGSASVSWDLCSVLPLLLPWSTNPALINTEQENRDTEKDHEPRLLSVSRRFYNRPLIIQSLFHWLLRISLHKSH